MNGNKIKRALAVLVCALMLIQCTSLGVFAADIDPEAVVYVRPEVTEVVANQIGKNYIFVDITTVESKNDQTIMVYLTDKNGNLVTLAYAVVGSNEAEAKLGVPDSVETGTYKIVVALSKAADVTKSEVFYVGVGDVDGFFEAVNSEDADVVKEKLEAHYEALSVVESTKDIKLTGDSYEALSDDTKATFAELIANGVNGTYSNGKGEFDAENSESFIKEAYVVAVYNEGDLSDAELAKVVYNFSETIGFDADDENLYGSIQNKDTFVKVAKSTAETVNSAEELAKVLETAAAIQKVNESHWLSLVDVVAANNNLFEVDESEITKLQSTKKLRTYFCEYFKGTYYTIEEIQDAWDAAYEKAEDKVSSSGGGGGGGGTTTEKTTSTTTVVNIVSSQITDDANNKDPKVEIKDYYTDMSDDYSWASEGVLNLTKAQIVSGYGDMTFRPGNSVTRAEFMKMLVNVFGFGDITATCSFTDVDKDAWYYVYVASAEKVGIAQGYGNGLFGVNDPITRQDAVTLIYRAAKLKGLSLEKFSASIEAFTDKDEIAPYAVEAAGALFNAGIYLDASDPKTVNKFEPTRYASRAYLAVVLNQIYTYMN